MPPCGTGFFRQKIMVGIGGGQNLNNRLFGGSINFGHEVVGGLSADPQQIKIKACAVDNRAGAASRFDGCIQQWVHGRVF
jgi:hypothetical protein